MLEIVKEYEDDGYIVKELSFDGGETISHVIREKKPVEREPEPPVQDEQQPTLEEMQAQTLINTEYLVTMSELSNLKGE
ncbi:hypothetical protein [Viridibacillus arvi]|uniref:hypothetical protein n=1 Tax=Viridibacillus arvi TaxID=263475 RepID=UPI003D0314D5